MADHGESLTCELLINGTWETGSPSAVMEHTSPITGKVQAEFPVADDGLVDRAVNAARAALPGWRATPRSERAALLRKVAALIRSDAGQLGQIATLENGTPTTIAGFQVGIAADTFEYYAGWVDKVTGDVLPTDGTFSYTSVEPVGVVALVLTWNTPPPSFALKVAAALAAGCTAVIKAPEQAPFSTTALGRLLVDAGVPDGVINIVSGGPETGNFLVTHPEVDKVSFTGGPSAAREIQEACATRATPLVLELGGKSAALVLNDADLDSAAASVAFGFAALSGQICVAPTRAIVHRSVQDQFVEKLLTTLAMVTVGDPRYPATMAGPLISERALSRVLSVVETSAGVDGRLVSGGERLTGALADGFYMSAAVLTDVDSSSRLAQDEVFGPVLAITGFDDVDEAVQVTNGTRYGLAAYIHTADLGTGLRLAGALDAGNVSVNGAMAAISPVGPFGGTKGSGYGREGGLQGLMEFTRVKNVNVAAQ